MIRLLVSVVLILGLTLGASCQVLFQLGPRSIAVELPSDIWSSVSGTVRYQGPVFSPDNPNWKPPHRYEGIPLEQVIEALGGMGEDDLLWVIAVDGYAKALPRPVVYGDTPLGTPILAFSCDGARGPEWDAGPELIFLAPDGDVSNEDQVEALGEHAHYFQDRPSATGLMVKGVTWMVLNWDADISSLPQVGLWPSEAQVTIVTGEERTFSLRELETHYTSLTGWGIYTTSSGREVRATWTGIPVRELVGPWLDDTELEVVAADGYRMRYRYGELADEEGEWVLAFKRGGEYLPFDPGFFRLVKVGPSGARFPGSRSARMVVRIEVHGPYQPYSLRLSGAVERGFDRAELEAGVGCPCHARAVTVTHKGETHTYSGLPLWRLLAYVDDARFPDPEQGIFYDDADFNDQLAGAGYLVEIRAADGYSQTIASTYLAHDDRYIIALKRDGEFLTAEEGGPLMFVWDDSAPTPDGLKRVKWVTEIVILYSD